MDRNEEMIPWRPVVTSLPHIWPCDPSGSGPRAVPEADEEGKGTPGERLEKVSNVRMSTGRAVKEQLTEGNGGF
jgi:hypothetical protein